MFNYSHQVSAIANAIGRRSRYANAFPSFFPKGTPVIVVLSSVWHCQ
ncbi:MAG: hypothetical protein F6K37_12210 [Moorea sp. SIO4E2]|nr:hypothetical protein [Moorena sp. SIO4E2]NEQ06667.1 hypothetical protein [Moorena sp. SIO4E2]